MEAEVGDEQHGSDPTTLELCDRMAALLGKEAAVFMPSGTMCNEVAILTQCRPGDEILAHPTAHITSSEGGAPWALAGVQVTGLPGEGGQFSVGRAAGGDPPADALCAAAADGRGGADRQSRRRHGSGRSRRCTPSPTLAHEHGMVTHMDGARLMNAVVASGVTGGRDGGRLRHGVAGLHQGPGRAARRGAGRVGGGDRRGVALEAAGRRLDAAVRHLRRGLPLCARPQHRPSGRGPRERPRPGPRAGADPGHHGRAAARPTWCSSTCPAPG